MPRFAEGDKGSDWNDYAKQHGDDAARKELARQVAQAKTEAAMTAERMTFLAHEREAEARNDPTTTADDEKAAQERGAAGELLRRAVTDSAEARAEAIDALVTSAGGQSRPAASVGATMDHTNADMLDEVKEQREQVLDGHNVSTTPEDVRDGWAVYRQPGLRRPGDQVVEGSAWWDDKMQLVGEAHENPSEREAMMATLGKRPAEGTRILVTADDARVFDRRAEQRTAQRQKAHGRGYDAEM